jgi:hypothetical protein
MNRAKDLVIFKAGTWNGETYTESDLDNMARSFNADEPIPFIIGHSSDYKGHTRIPVFGRIMGGLKRVGHDLIAMGVEFNDKLAEWIREGFYPQRSIELTKDNKRVLAVGMLGAAPPAVKGLPGNDEALREIALQFSEMKESKVVEFSLDGIEALAVDDTFDSLSKVCMKFLETIEKMLVDGTEPDKMASELWEMQADMCQALNLHEQFLKKIEQIESKGEMSEKRGWKQFKEKLTGLFNKRKETDMDALKEKEYQDKITTLDALLKEFQDKEAAETTAKAAAETARLAAEATATTEAQVAEVKQFCETAIKENRMTPAMREVDEKIMLDLAKTTPGALKSFQQKYVAGIVPLGEVKELNEQPKLPEGKLEKAAAYVKAHGTDKEFADCRTEGDKVARAVYLEGMGQVKF